MTEKMTADQVVGQRIADLRQQRALKQDEFLLLLEEVGLGWTRSVLSRVESGLRPLRWTEGISVASALGVNPAELSTEVNTLTELERKSHQLRIKRNEAVAMKKSASNVIAASNSLLTVLLATRALTTNSNASFMIRNDPVDFMNSLATALRENPFDEYGPFTSVGEDRDRAYALLGLVDPEIEWNETTEAPDDPESREMDEYSAKAEEFETNSLTKQFSKLYPKVEFTNGRRSAHIVIDGIAFEEIDGR